MNQTDARLLAALQADSNRPIAQLAEMLAMSTSACHRRMRALEEQGVIAGYSARVDPACLGLKLHAFVEVTLASQSREAMERFENAVAAYDEILECHLMSGNADYLLRIAVQDIDRFGDVHRECLSRLPGVASMRSSFSIREVKPWSGYPIPG